MIFFLNEGENVKVNFIRKKQVELPKLYSQINTDFSRFSPSVYFYKHVYHSLRGAIASRIKFTTHLNTTLTLIGQARPTDPEVGRYCYFAVESPLPGWRKASRYHAEKTEIQTTHHRKLGRINTPVAVVTPTAASLVYFFSPIRQNDGRNRPVPSASSQRRDAALGERWWWGKQKHAGCSYL